MFYNVMGQRKYDAWMRYDTKTEEECMEKYISIVNRFR